MASYQLSDDHIELLVDKDWTVDQLRRAQLQPLQPQSLWRIPTAAVS